VTIFRIFEIDTLPALYPPFPAARWHRKDEERCAAAALELPCNRLGSL